MKFFQTVFASILMTTGWAQAATIVDTGMPDTRGSNLGFSTSFATEGVQFTTDSVVTITSIQSVFSDAHTFLTPTDVVMYGGIAANDSSSGTDLPGTMLLESAFTVSQGTTPDWYGPSGLSWTLDPGTYWATFWLKPASCSNCGVASYINPPTSLPSAGGTSAGTGIPHDWAAAADSWGLRVTAVPVPAAVWLFATGLLGLLGIAGRRKI